jgi:hypothetical protein
MWARIIGKRTSILSQCVFLTLQKAVAPTHDWWLFVSTSKTTPPRLTVVYMTSDDSPGHIGVVRLLAARVVYRLYRIQPRLASLTNAEDFVTTVNRQIIRATRRMPV